MLCSNYAWRISVNRQFRLFSSVGSVIGDPFKWDVATHSRDMFMIDDMISEDERMVRYVCFLWFA